MSQLQYMLLQSMCCPQTRIKMSVLIKSVGAHKVCYTHDCGREMTVSQLLILNTFNSIWPHLSTDVVTSNLASRNIAGTALYRVYTVSQNAPTLKRYSSKL